MADEYGYPEKRRSKKDLKRKRRFRVYKKGGKYRGINVNGRGKEEIS